MNKKVHCACRHNSYASWLRPLGFTITDDPDEADLLLLAGGQDIDFRLYSKHQGRFTGNPGRRDEIELDLYKQFNKEGKYMLGICRGAQFICAMQPGGALIQDMRHPHHHTVVTNDGQKMSCVSMHHQMQFLRDIDPKTYELLAWAENLSPYHLDGEDNDFDLPDNYQEPEVVIYNNRQLGIQSHPEVMSLNSPFVHYCQNLVRRYILNEKEIDYASDGLGRGSDRGYTPKEKDFYFVADDYI